MKKLVCDRCGREISSPADIELVLAGTEAWQNSVRTRGEEPRGLFPCEYYRICKGEMIIVEAETKKEKLSVKVKNLFHK
ncbi:MAG: hypothetical protein JW712_00005 [Dehalococcoidales bacterium]|nr:hypothetical protein [Dehalococcoidales bacterium]